MSFSNNINRKQYRYFITFLNCSFLLLYLCGYTRGQESPYTLKVPFRDTTTILREIDYAKRFIVSYPDSAIELLRLPFQQSKQQHFDYGSGLALMHMGSAYSNTGQYNKAETLYRDAIRYLDRSISGRREIPQAMCNLGNVSFLNGDYERSLKYYYDALNLAKEKFPDLNTDFIYSNLAGVLTQMGRDPESARYYLDKAEEAARKHNNFLTLCKIYSNKGFAYITYKKWDSSLYYFNKAYELSIKQGFTDMQHLTLTNMGVVYLEQNKGDSALHYLLRALPLENQVTAAVRERSKAMLGVAYLQNRQYAQAAPLLNSQFRQALASGDKVELRDAYYNLARLHGALENYQEAFSNAWNYIQLNDSIGGSEVIRNVNNLEVEFRTAEKEKTIIKKQLIIAQQEKEIANKNRWITIFISCGLILSLLFFTIWKGYRSRQKLLAERLNNLEQHRELENLRATIKGEEKERLRIARELHDGIGGLISAAKMNLVALGRAHYAILNHDIYQSTAEILEEVGDELRLTAHNMMPRALMEKNLAEAIISFCRYTQQHKKIQIEVQAYGHFESLSDNYQLGIYRIIQELVHNIVKHAKATKALVQLSFQDNVISVTVEDNGKGMDKQRAETSNGVGLESIRTRVKSMQGSYSVNTQPGKGTSFYIEFDLSGK